MSGIRNRLFSFFLLVLMVISFAEVAFARPTDGWNLHIDAKKHFPGNPDALAHHYCKPVSEGLIECQLYDSDADNAKLVGTEMVVTTDVYNSFTASEKTKWHYHKEEIPKVEATLPDLSAEEAAKVAKSLEETYGKIYLFWDPTKGELPTGDPFVHILDSAAQSNKSALQSVGILLLILVILLIINRLIPRPARPKR